MVARAILVLTIALTVWSCSWHVQKSVAFDHSISIRDPLLLKLAPAAENLDLDAEGQLLPGTYEVGSGQSGTVPIKIDKDTGFKFSVHLPLNGATTVSTRNATGKLETTQPLIVSNIPSPTAITLDHGKATVDVDLARAILAGIVNICHAGGAEGARSSITQMIGPFRISSASLTLRKSPAEWNDLRLKVDSGKITLEDAAFQNKSDFSGTCTMRAAVSGVQRKESERRIGVAADNCNINLQFFMQRKGSAVSLKMHPEFQNTMEISKLELARKTSRLTSASSKADFRSIECAHTMNTNDRSLSASARLLLGDASVHADSQARSIAGDLIMKNSALLNLDIENKNDFLEVSLPSAKAKNVTLSIAKPHSKIGIVMHEAGLTDLLFRKDAHMSLTLSKGEFSPSRVRWSSGKRQADIKIVNGTKIKIDRPITISTTDIGAVVFRNVPLEMKAGAMYLTNGKEKIALDGIAGKMLVSVEGPEAEVQGSIKAHANKQGLLGIPDFNASAKGLSLTSSPEHVHLKLSECQLVFPRESLRNAVQDSLSSGKSFPVNKLVFADRKWRYRNMTLESVKVEQPAVTELAIDAKNNVAVAGKAKVTAIGTVERYNMKINPLSKTERGWIKKTWSGQGTVSGKGNVQLVFVPEKSLSDSKINYDAAITFAVPEDLELDWSQVDEGLLGKSEKALVAGVIKHAGTFTDTRGIPLKVAGSIKLFKTSDPRLKLIRISNATLVPSKSNVQVKFSADAVL